MLGYQAIISAYVIRNEIHLPYTAATDCARYLAPLVEQHHKIYGFQYGMVAVSAYYDHNIFANWQNAYYHHDISSYDTRKAGAEIAAGQPEYVVTMWWKAPDPKAFREEQFNVLHSLGYSLVHGSDGFLLTKWGYSGRQLYFVYKREP